MSLKCIVTTNSIPLNNQIIGEIIEAGINKIVLQPSEKPVDAKMVGYGSLVDAYLTYPWDSDALIKILQRLAEIHFTSMNRMGRIKYIYPDDSNHPS